MTARTEEQARKSWCPHARYVIDTNGHGGYPSGNRFGGYERGEAGSLCLGSACMAWRWAEPYQLGKNGVAYAHNRHPDETTGTLTLVQPGYCGLAGEPRR